MHHEITSQYKMVSCEWVKPIARKSRLDSNMMPFKWIKHTHAHIYLMCYTFIFNGLWGPSGSIPSQSRVLLGSWPSVKAKLIGFSTSLYFSKSTTQMFFHLYILPRIKMNIYLDICCEIIPVFILKFIHL